MLQGKTALITGGSRGIGRAITEEFCAQGANVIFTYLSDSNSASELTTHLKSLGATCLALQMDVRSSQSIENAFIDSINKFGSLDVLVNNAGINNPVDFDLLAEDDWDHILSVNLKGPYLCSQTALKFMNKTSGGSIINIGSISGQYGGPRTAHYAASKAGLISLSQVIARFAAKYNIRSNTIAAGLIQSEMADVGLKSESVRRAAENIPLGRLGSPVDVARMATFLASDNSSYITAQTFNVNGGLYF